MGQPYGPLWAAPSRRGAASEGRASALGYRSAPRWAHQRRRYPTAAPAAVPFGAVVVGLQPARLSKSLNLAVIHTRLSRGYCGAPTGHTDRHGLYEAAGQLIDGPPDGQTGAASG